MVGRLGTSADILITESVLGKVLETIDSMLLDSPLAGVGLDGEEVTDGQGTYYRIDGISDIAPIGLSLGSSEGGTEPTDDDLRTFKKLMDRGILMKVDVFAHQFSFYFVDDEVRDATVLFVERSYPDGVPAAHLLFGYVHLGHDVADHAFEEQMGRILEDRSQGCDPADVVIRFDVQDDGHI